MPLIAKWEIWSLANMLISTQGERAIEVARERLKEAESRADLGQTLVWEEVVEALERR